LRQSRTTPYNYLAMSKHTTASKPATIHPHTALCVAFDSLATLPASERVDALRVISRMAHNLAEADEQAVRVEHEKRMGVSLAHLSLHRGMWVRRVRVNVREGLTRLAHARISKR
jgi:hypothetical protein